MPDDRFIVTLDLGTTNIRVSVYDSRNNCHKYRLSENIAVITDNNGKFEFDPISIYIQSVELIKKVLYDCNINDENLLSLGISTHRGSFLLWNKKTSEPLTNLISWKDTRCNKEVNEWNKSYSFRLIKMYAGIMYFLTKSNRMSIIKNIKFTHIHVIIRLYWVAKNAHINLKDEDILFGTLETWMIWKLTNGKVHVTDTSSVSATGMHDLTTNSWNNDALYIFGIPHNILPKIVPTHGEILAMIDKSFFDFPIKITCLVADQSAASFGSGCFYENEMKCTLGTGTFIDITTGNKIIPKVKSNFYPLIGWSDKKNTTYVFEGFISKTADKIINFMSNENLNDPKTITEMALYSENIGFNGISTKYNLNACKKARSVLDSIVFDFYTLWLKFQNMQLEIDINKIYASGGVSNSDYILQNISTICGIEIIRLAEVESTSLGTMLLSKISLGFCLDDLKIAIDKTFIPASSDFRKFLIERYNNYNLN